MITLIHGSDTAKSRNYYLELRQSAKDKVILDGEKITETDLLQALSGSGLFGDNQEIFIEELLSKRKSSKELDALLSTISDTSQKVTLWESKDLTPKQTSSFTKASVKQFKLPTIIFTFVDALAPGNGKKLITLFHELLTYEEAIFALSMVQRQVRILLALQSQSTQNISEVSRLAPWQMGKLKKQAGMFTLEQLIALHRQLYELELGQKTGGLSLPLDQAIDFLLLSI